MKRSQAAMWHNSAKKRKVRRALEPFRPRRKRVVLEAVRREGEPIHDPAKIGQTFADEWGSPFAEVEADEEQAAYFEQFVVGSDDELDRRWSPGGLRGIAQRLPKSVLELDGLPYAFSASTSDTALVVSDEAAERMQAGGEAPPQLIESYMLSCRRASPARSPELSQGRWLRRGPSP